ncbi:MAG TPA: hypothetical protein VGG39_15805 [Polyangiaceae bacterium]|jgi:hypothetical protein
MQVRRSYAVDEGGHFEVFDFPLDATPSDLSAHYPRAGARGLTPTRLEVDHRGGVLLMPRESGVGAEAAERELLAAFNQDLGLRAPHPRSFDPPGCAS